MVKYLYIEPHRLRKKHETGKTYVLYRTDTRQLFVCVNETLVIHIVLYFICKEIRPLGS
jgi:hypothetical protein